MDYDDFPMLNDNIVAQMAIEYGNKVHAVKVAETEPVEEPAQDNSEFFSKLSEGLQLGISFLEVLLKFSKTIFKVRRVKDDISSALSQEKAELDELKLNSVQASSPPIRWGGFFRRNCDTYLNSEFILLYLLLNELRKPKPALPQEKIIDMAMHHINNVKLVDSLII